MPTGTVKFFLNQKGYGFITEDETNEEIFVHVSGLIDKVNAEDKVSFDRRYRYGDPAFGGFCPGGSVQCGVLFGVFSLRIDRARGI